jgi:hypothetical protein
MSKDTVPNSQMIAGLILAQETIINMLIESNVLNRDEVIVRFSQIVKDMGDEPGDISDIPLRVIAKKLAGVPGHMTRHLPQSLPCLGHSPWQLLPDEMPPYPRP